MDQSTFNDCLRQQRLLPLFTPRDEQSSCRFIDILLTHGFPLIELTLRDEGAKRVLPILAQRFPQAKLGAGTIVKAESLIALSFSGMQFAVTPGVLTGLPPVDQSPLPLLPGVATPSEIIACANLGYDLLKLFPAKLLGGVDYVRALSGPFPEIRFCLTGGIKADALLELLSAPGVAACGGSWLASDAELAEGEWATIERRVQSARELLDSQSAEGEFKLTLRSPFQL